MRIFALALAKAAPRAKLAMIPGMTNVLRIAADDTRAASAATYPDTALPVAPALVDAIAGFVSPALRPAAAQDAARP